MMSLNTDPKVVKQVAFQFTQKELLTPTLIYVWNAQPDELEKLVDEIIGRMSPDFIGRYIREDFRRFQSSLFLLSVGHLYAAFRELISRADHAKLRHMGMYIQLLIEAPCKTDECRENCNEYYRNTDNAS